jgi:hypothetical protein
MKHLRLCAKFSALTLVGATGLGCAAVPYKANANDDNPRSGDGASYLITVTDSNGNFFTRGILTLHADHTMFVVEADSGRPTYYFTSERGSWRPDDTGGAIGRALDFDLIRPAAHGSGSNGWTPRPGGSSSSGGRRPCNPSSGSDSARPWTSGGCLRWRRDGYNARHNREPELAWRTDRFEKTTHLAFQAGVR